MLGVLLGDEVAYEGATCVKGCRCPAIMSVELFSENVSCRGVRVLWISSL